MKSHLTFACLLASIITSVAAQNKREKLNEIMKAFYNYNMLDGSVLVDENRKMIYEAAFGLVNSECLFQTQRTNNKE